MAQQRPQTTQLPYEQTPLRELSAMARKLREQQAEIGKQLAPIVEEIGKRSEAQKQLRELASVAENDPNKADDILLGNTDKAE